MRYNHFAAALFELRKEPPLSLIITFIAGFLFFGLSVNFLYDFTKNTGTVAWLGVLFIIAALSYWVYVRNISLTQKVKDANSIAPMRWVITSVSPYQPPKDGKPDNFKLLDLAKHHSTRIERMYLVGMFSDKPVPDDEGVEAAYTRLISCLEDPNVQFQFPKLKPDMVTKIPVSSADSAEECFRVVNNLLRQIEPNEAIYFQDIVIDVTDGRKPMSIGLALAALTNGCHLSYLSAERDTSGLPIRGGKQTYIELKSSLNIVKTIDDTTDNT